MAELILPDNNGMPNLEIRRMQRELEKERANTRGVHDETAHELSKALDELRVYSDQGKVRALFVVCIMRDPPKTRVMSELGPECRALFACPRSDRELAVNLCHATDAFKDLVMSSQYPGPPNKPAS